MKNILPFLLLICFATSLLGQKIQKGAIITQIQLHDGSTLKGFIQKKHDDGSLDFLILGNYPTRLEPHIIKNKEKGDPHKLYFTDGKYFRTRGYYNVLRIGSIWAKEGTTNRSPPVQDQPVNGFSGLNIMNMHGYQLNKWISLGLGAGIDIYNVNENRSQTFLPVFFDFRTYPFDNKVSPYFVLNGGYGFGVDIFDNFSESADEFYEGGWMAAPALGFRFASDRKGNFLLELGYRLQDTKAQYIIYRDFPLTLEKEVVLKRVDVAFGWIF